MDLVKQLAQKKSAVVKAWFEKVVNTYPIDTAQFLKNQSDPFANPVGQNSLKSLAAAFDLVLGGFDRNTAGPLIDPIIRIRAIQDFAPSQAVGFMFDLKKVLRESVPVDDKDIQSQKALQLLDSRIDELGLLAFDIFMQCREKIYDLKANEMRSRTYRAFARAGLIKEPDDQ
jgi:RsbT co-antagonist protein rsbRD N-terminal domain